MSTVQLTIRKIDTAALWKGGEELVAWEYEQQAIYEAAQAWASVRGYDRVKPAIDYMLGGAPPKSGFHVFISKPTNLMFYATWPWAPAYGRDE